MTWPFPMRSLSPTSMAKFQKCPEQWRRQYLLGQWDRTGMAALVGSAVHESAEKNYKQKAVTWEDLPTSDVEIAYAEAFDKEVEEKGGPDEIDWTVKKGTFVQTVAPGKAKDSGVALVRKYHEEIAPTIVPIASEEWFRIDVPGVEVPIKGKIDLIKADRETGMPVEKDDLKFGRVAKETAEASWRLQALTYMLVDETTERDGTVRFGGLSGLPFGWHTGSWGGPRSEPKIFVPDTAPGLVIPFEETTVELAHAHIKATVFNMLSLHERYGPDEPWPTPALQHTWACGYCPFHPSKGGSCYWWSGIREPAITLI